MINYDNKTFKLVSSSGNSETSSLTLFNYKQKGAILTATYKGGAVLSGHLIGLVDNNGVINMRYHHINNKNELMAGICTSTPEIDAEGKIILHESWQWTTGNCTKGNSILKEL